MAVRITLKNDQVGPKFQVAMKRQAKRARAAMRVALAEAAAEIESLGRADIAAAGRFGRRWIEGFTATVGEGGGHMRVRVEEQVPYWPVFEFGATIHGRPMLWIPLSFATDAQGVRARDYGAPLFRVDRFGKAPLLMTKTGKGKAEAKYFGKEHVTIPKKFHLREIIRRVASTIRARYNRAFKATATRA